MSNPAPLSTVKALFLPVLVALWLCAVVPAPAAVPIGTVIGLKGEVAARSGSDARPLSLSSRVFRGETVTTGPRGRVQIMFADDTMLAQGPDSATRLDDYVFDPEAPEESALSLVMGKGAFRVISGRVAEANPERFNLSTPLATIGIRGTMVGAVVGEGTETVMALDLDPEHFIEVLTNAGPAGAQRLYNDLMAVDVSGTGASAPRMAGVAELRGLLEATGLGLGGESPQDGDLSPEQTAQLAAAFTTFVASGGLDNVDAESVAQTLQDLYSEYLDSHGAASIDTGGDISEVGRLFFAAAVPGHHMESTNVFVEHHPYMNVNSLYSDLSDTSGEIYTLYEGGDTANTDAYLVFDDSFTVSYVKYGSLVTTATAAADMSYSRPTTSGDYDYLDFGLWSLNPLDHATASPNDYVLLDRLYVLETTHPTPVSAISDLAAAGASGTYSGGAAGSMRTYNFMADFTTENSSSGSFSGSVDFATGRVTDLSIVLQFGSGDLTMDYGTATIDGYQFVTDPGSFDVSMPNMATGSGSANGVFTGPNAEEMGGTLEAYDGTGQAVTGIFHGKR